MWFYLLNDQQHGPVSQEELKGLLDSHTLQLKTPVRREDMRTWVPLDQVEFGTSPDEATLPRPPELPLQDGYQVCAFSGKSAQVDEMTQIDSFWIAKSHEQEALEFVQRGGWLPTSESGLRSQGNLDFGYLFQKAKALLLSSLGPVLTVYFVINLPLSILMGLQLPSTTAAPTANGMPEFPPPGVGLAMGVAMAVSLLANAGILFLFRQHSRGDRAGFKRAILAAIALWVPFLLGMIIVGSLVMAGILLLIIPGVIVSVRLSFTFASMVERRLNPMAALANSFAITSGHGLHIFLFTVMVTLGCAIPGMVVSSLIEMIVQAVAPVASHSKGFAVFASVLSAALSFPCVYGYACLYCYYKELEALWLNRVEANR